MNIFTKLKNIKSKIIMKKHSKQLLKISLVTFSILALFPILSSNAGIGQALAQVVDSSYNISSNSLTRVMCNALRLVTGSAGKTFAAFAIIATGIGFFTGKVSWGLMIGVTAGIATMFGAPSIVAAISGQDTNMTCNLN
jgi:type IV secretory pathway VirB2 component (pilin)